MSWTVLPKFSKEKPESEWLFVHDALVSLSPMGEIVPPTQDPKPAWIHAQHKWDEFLEQMCESEKKKGADWQSKCAERLKTDGHTENHVQELRSTVRYLIQSVKEATAETIEKADNVNRLIQKINVESEHPQPGVGSEVVEKALQVYVGVGDLGAGAPAAPTPSAGVVALRKPPVIPGTPYTTKCEPGSPSPDPFKSMMEALQTSAKYTSAKVFECDLRQHTWAAVHADWLETLPQTQKDFLKQYFDNVDKAWKGRFPGSTIDQTEAAKGTGAENLEKHYQEIGEPKSKPTKDDAVVSFTLVSPWKEGKASNCDNVGCDSFDGTEAGLAQCKKSCIGECTLINFVPVGASGTSGPGRCCRRKCTSSADFKLVSEWAGWDVYAKSVGFFSRNTISVFFPRSGNLVTFF